MTKHESTLVEPELAEAINSYTAALRAVPAP